MRLRKYTASRFSRPPNAFGIHWPGFARVIEVEHRRDRIHAQTVDVILVQPEERVADQEIAHLVAAVVENQRAPILVLALARIHVLVQIGAVEFRETRARPSGNAPAPNP